MNEVEHFKWLNRYYNKSRWKYNFFLHGSKHFGLYPDEKWIPTKTAQELMQDLVAEKLRLREGMMVLDAGCGQGITSTYLAKKYGCCVEGVTIVPFEIKEANHLANKLSVSDKVHHSLVDYSKLDFSDNYFDAVYSQESLVHSIDIKKTLKELYRVLKKDGRIAFFEYSMADDNKFSEEELKTMSEMNYSSAMHSLPDMRHGMFEKLLTDVGFRDVSVENISNKVGPMIRLYEKFAKPIYFFVRGLGLASKTPNLVAAARMIEFSEKDLVRYNIFTGHK